MAEERGRARVLIVGGSGYMGKHLAVASLREGHPTLLLLRPDAIRSNVNKAQHFLCLRRAGARLLKGTLEDFAALVNVIKQVDVVVSAMAEDRLLEQLKLVEAIKEAGNVKRFLPSEFGMDPDQLVDCPSPIGDVFAHKRQIRRTVEEYHIPFTYVSANCFAGYFVAGLAQYEQFIPPTENVLIYGDGNQKVIWNKEEDVATYAIKTIDDPRALNKTVYIRPPLNILSQNELVMLWEELQGRPLKKTFIDEGTWMSKVQDSQDSFDKYVMGVLHLIFFQGRTYNIEIGANSEEASSLYPEYEYEPMKKYLSYFI